MPQSFESSDIITLLFLVLAVVIFLRLRSVLGKRTGHERPPYDPSAAQTEDNQSYENDNVVQLPTGRENKETAKRIDDEEVIKDLIRDYAPEGSELETGLVSIIKQDDNFEPKTFLEGARMAYEMIVMAFNDGNRTVLKPLLSSDVYESFEAEITNREDREEVVDSSFVGIDKAVIIDAELRGKEALVTLKFVSKIITAVRDKAGDVVSGDPKKIIEVTDIWTFSRNTASRDPNWKLIGTESAN